MRSRCSRSIIIDVGACDRVFHLVTDFDTEPVRGWRH